MNQVFAAGCALHLYKPDLAEKVLKFLMQDLPGLTAHYTCCHHEPNLPADTRVINICPGCDKRYRTLYEGVTTISLWELLAESEGFPFPDYAGRRMAIHDACPTRDQARVHKAIRTLLQRMNIELLEPAKTGTYSVCCGDSFFGTIPVEKVKIQMSKRAAQMPVENVVVYCVSCIKSMSIGGKRPRYLVDLLFGEETVPGVVEPDLWHAQVDEFIAAH